MKEKTLTITLIFLLIISNSANPIFKKKEKYLDLLLKRNK